MTMTTGLPFALSCGQSIVQSLRDYPFAPLRGDFASLVVVQNFVLF